jgi:GNAT superfamily N-acetyltransferase
LPWEDATGGWELAGHDPLGDTLYGADISVHPDWRGKGVGRALYEARFDLVRRTSLARFGTACRLPGLRASGMSAGRYCADVAGGLLVDRTLTPLLRYGLEYLGVIEGYMEDPESLDAAAVLEWRP